MTTNGTVKPMDMWRLMMSACSLLSDRVSDIHADSFAPFKVRRPHTYRSFQVCVIKLFHLGIPSVQHAHADEEQEHADDTRWKHNADPDEQAVQAPD